MKLSLGAIQTPVVQDWDGLRPWLEEIAWRDGPCLWLLPELVIGGFDYPRRQEWLENTRQAMPRIQQFASESEQALAGSFWEERDGRLHNTLYFFHPDGDAPRVIYRKQHLFPGVEESRVFTPGETDVDIVEWQGLRLGGAICFDLRFPELFRVQAAEGVDVFLVPGQWPRTRLTHWRRLLAARAIENQSFVLSCNAVGETPLGVMPGHSCLISPWGDVVFSILAGAGVKSGPLSTSHLQRARRLYTTRADPFYTVQPTPRTNLDSTPGTG
ncbi:nitrilase-related carbon-nitrogen hydrolase [Desulfohalovibrio reitneri]|uniref:nitrilase-related carbon-nitrogen hydrolase n=1 Tax=Desulfohalovibrio reitneri TaxID=1307759 RepID=UPI0004A715AA|nr:nitrilase-related carbon-nitrogen hydrolase [Desulfohalovibrio reitneri]